MGGKNATPLIGWHSADPTLKPWLEAEVERRGMHTMRELLDEMAAEYRERVDELAPFRDASEAGTVNAEMRAGLRGALTTQATEAGEKS